MTSNQQPASGAVCSLPEFLCLLSVYSLMSRPSCAPVQRRVTYPEEGHLPRGVYSCPEEGAPDQRRVTYPEEGHLPRGGCSCPEEGAPAQRRVTYPEEGDLPRGGSPAQRRVTCSEEGAPAQRRVLLPRGGSPAQRRVLLPRGGCSCLEKGLVVCDVDTFRRLVNQLVNDVV